MASYSGVAGWVEVGDAAVAHITSWRLISTSTNPAYASSETGGAKTRVPGVRDSNGQFRGKLDDAEAQAETVAEGSLVNLKLYTDATHYVIVPAIIDRLQIEVDVDRGEIVSFVADFSGTGAVDYTHL